MLVATDVRFWRRSIGSQVRISALLEHFIDRGFRVHVVFVGAALSTDEKGLGAWKDKLDIRFATRRNPGAATEPNTPRRKRWFRRGLAQLIQNAKRVRTEGLSALHNRPFLLALQAHKLRHFERPEIKRQFLQCYEEIRPDVVLIQYVRLAYLLAGLPHRESTKALIDTHDVQHLRQKRFHDEGFVHDLDITAGEEAARLSLADAVMAIQVSDGEELKRMLPDTVDVLVVPHPNPVVATAPSASRQPPIKIVFVGSSMKPNVEALRYTIDQIVPRLRQAVSMPVELHAYGAVCSHVEAGDTDGVLLHGFVDDVGEAWRSADIAFNPIAMGGGLKIKNVEALCNGCALVTTSVGAEGLNEASGTAFLQSDDLDGQISLLARLVEYPEQRQQLSEEAVVYARRTFDTKAAFAELDAFLDS